MPNLPEHFEQHLGKISRGWSRSAQGAPGAFQVAQIVGSFPGGVAFVTLGLSRHQLASRVSGRLVRQELLMLSTQHQHYGIPALLQQVGAELLLTHQALLRGDVIGPRGALAEQSAMEALYVTVPSYFEDDFAICSDDELGDVVVTWLVPISGGEAKYVKRAGWDAFEDLLVERQPDLTDVFRKPIR